MSFSSMFEIFDHLKGILTMSDRKNQSQADRQNTVECNEYILNVMADADATRTIGIVTGKELREQMTVEQAIALRNQAEAYKRGQP